jgi:hypothetical protein
MILASFIGIFAIPPLYVMFQAVREKLRPSSRPKKPPIPEETKKPLATPDKSVRTRPEVPAE